MYHAATTDFDTLQKEYQYCWENLTSKMALPPFMLTKITANKKRYSNIAKAVNSGMPWWFVALVHYREASLDFNTCLHNGDKLPGPTHNVPAGRGPFKSWDEGAIDALIYEGFDKKNFSSLAQCFYHLESYNGFGYRIGKTRPFILRSWPFVWWGSMQETTPRNASPYIFNGTQFYIKGLSKEDNSFYKNAVDDQIGCMTLLKQIFKATNESYPVK